MVRTGENWAKDAGVYEFTMGADGSKVRFVGTFWFYGRIVLVDEATVILKNVQNPLAFSTFHF